MFEKFKNLFVKGGSVNAQVYSLEEILDLAYVQDILKDDDVEKIRSTYNLAPLESKVILSEKLRSMEEIYQKVLKEEELTVTSDLLDARISLHASNSKPT